MPLEFHKDRRAMFEQQFLNAREHVVPFVAGHRKLSGASVLDVGSGEGGVLKAFVEAGAAGVGVELSPARAAFARETLEQECDAGVLEFVVGDIHDHAVTASWENRFDVVILKDSIEHITRKEALLRRLAAFLRPEGVVFVGFPPWRMPFGGHQQIARSRFARLPYYHLLPRPIYTAILRTLGESEGTVEDLLEIRDTRLSISGFERLLERVRYTIVERRLFLINPIYRYKFGLRPRRQFRPVASLPWLRDFVTTTCYYLIRPSQVHEDERIKEV